MDLTDIFDMYSYIVKRGLFPDLLEIRSLKCPSCTRRMDIWEEKKTVVPLYHCVHCDEWYCLLTSEEEEVITDETQLTLYRVN